MPESQILVREKGVEPLCREALGSKPSVSASSTTPAHSIVLKLILKDILPKNYKSFGLARYT